MSPAPDPGSDPAPDDPPATPRSTPPAVVVVDAETPGNVGTIARAMKNFGFADLKLVDPPEITRDSEAYGFAGHAREDVLPNAEELSFDAVVERYHTVGFTAITAEDARSHVRFPFRTPRELAASLATVETRTALVFGREGTGLSNAELERLDEVCSIPASESYPVLNLGQAATVALYELRSLTLGPDGEGTQLPDVDRERAAEADIDRFYEFFEAFLSRLEHRDHKREKSMRMLRRLVGRAHPTEREITTLTGLFRKAAERVEPRGSGTDAGAGRDPDPDTDADADADADPPR
jgi:TrmH family RNA methyltransferase